MIVWDVYAQSREIKLNKAKSYPHFCVLPVSRADYIIGVKDLRAYSWSDLFAYDI